MPQAAGKTFNVPVDGKSSVYKKPYLATVIFFLMVAYLIRYAFFGQNLALILPISALSLALLWIKNFGCRDALIVLLSLVLVSSETFLFLAAKTIYSDFYLWVAVVVVFTILFASLRIGIALSILYSIGEIYLIDFNGKYGHSLGSNLDFDIYLEKYIASLVLAEFFLIATLLIFKHMRKKMLQELYRLKFEGTRSTLTAVSIEMLGKLAHELNNPLAIIDACIVRWKMMLERGDKDGKSRVLLQTNMKDAVARIQKIFSKFDVFSEPHDLTMLAPADIEGLFTGIMSTIRTHSDSAVKFRLEMPETKMRLSCRQGQIEFILSVLLQNAFDAVSARTNPAVSVYIWKKTGAVHFEIEDNGGGVSEEATERIFQPFFSTKSVSDSLGMNLCVCHSIVSQLKGRIGFLRHRNATTFWFELPVEDSMSYA